jgi:hypothetical protein
MLTSTGSEIRRWSMTYTCWHLDILLVNHWFSSDCPLQSLRISWDFRMPGLKQQWWPCHVKPTHGEFWAPRTQPVVTANKQPDLCTIVKSEIHPTTHTKRHICHHHFLWNHSVPLDTSPLQTVTKPLMNTTPAGKLLLSNNFQQCINNTTNIIRQKKHQISTSHWATTSFVLNAPCFPSQHRCIFGSAKRSCNALGETLGGTSISPEAKDAENLTTLKSTARIWDIWFWMR